MVKAVRVHTVGGHHHLQVEDVELPHPGCDEVEVRHTAIGLNYLDVEDCKGGGRHARHSTFTPGVSAVGIITELGVEKYLATILDEVSNGTLVEAMRRIIQHNLSHSPCIPVFVVYFGPQGTGVLNHQIGQRVGYVHPPNKGAFSEANVVPIRCLIPLPSNITDEEAAALLYPGLTTWMLLKKVYPLQRGDAILVHNATNGLGSLIAQWAKHLHAFVIGAVGIEDDVELAEKNGCSEVIVYRDEAGPCGFVDEVRELTAGEGVAVAFDLVGKKTFMGSLDCLAAKGMLVSVGTTEGDAPVLNLKDLAGRGSLVLAVPILADYVKHQEDLLEGAQLLFELNKAGAIQAQFVEKFPLNVISKILEKVTKGDVLGSCILVPPIPDPKNVPHGS